MNRLLELARGAFRRVQESGRVTSPSEASDVTVPLFSIVICSIDPRKFQKICATYEQLFSQVPMEIIGVHDARSLCEGYNRGIAKAKGRYLVLSHDDIAILTPDLAERLTAHLQNFDVLGVAGTQRLVAGAWSKAGHPYDYCLIATPSSDQQGYVLHIKGYGGLTIPDIQALDGVFMAMHTHVAKDTGFDESTFDHFHLYDIDFTYRAHLKGYRLAVCRDILIIHDSHGDFGATWKTYKLRFEEKFKGRLDPDFPAIVSPTLRIQIGPEILADEVKMQWLGKAESLAGLIQGMDTYDFGAEAPPSHPARQGGGAAE